MVATVCVAGGGPAGLMLGLLLARTGVDVTVLEKHADFLRDFRGDTVHPSTLQVLDELGLGERFSALPYQRVRQAGTVVGGEEVVFADFGRLRVPYPYVAMVPQWDLLNLLADEAASHSNFRLLMNTEAQDLIWDADRVTGVRARRRSETSKEDATPHLLPGSEATSPRSSPRPEASRQRTGSGPDVLEVRAGLVVAADGRTSTLRSSAGMRPREFGSGMDVLWFRLPRLEGDPDEAIGLRLSPGRASIAIPRRNYWQIGYLIPKGGFDELRAAGIERLHEGFREVMPMLADRIESVSGWDQVARLEVRIDRLRRWYRSGLLCIGDAAHAMSPVGGVGINLAFQDAVAAANLLAEPLLEHQRDGRPVPDRVLAAVQARRRFPTVATQAFQRLAEWAAIRPTLQAGGRKVGAPRSLGPPIPGFALPIVRPLLSRMIGLGIRAEHVRTSAR